MTYTLTGSPEARAVWRMTDDSYTQMAVQSTIS